MPVFFELLFFFLESPLKAGVLPCWFKCSRFNIALVNNDITLQAFDLLENYRLSHGLLIADSLIAATALIADLEIFTYNAKDFTFISKLKLYTL